VSAVGAVARDTKLVVRSVWGLQLCLLGHALLLDRRAKLRVRRGGRIVRACGMGTADGVGRGRLAGADADLDLVWWLERVGRVFLADAGEVGFGLCWLQVDEVAVVALGRVSQPGGPGGRVRVRLAAWRAPALEELDLWLLLGVVVLA